MEKAKRSGRVEITLNEKSQALLKEVTSYLNMPVATYIKAALMDKLKRDVLK